MQDKYKILGVSKDATDEEIEQAYKTLRSKYSEERFCEGEVGNEAAKKLTKLDIAYREIKEDRESFSKQENGKTKTYDKVTELIKNGRLEDAQCVLDDDSNKDAEWHYLQSVVFYKKNWFNESKKQLEIAISMDPYNNKYKTAYDNLNRRTQTAQAQFQNGNNYNANQQQNRQMGGDACGSMADCCAMWCCMDTLCSCFCR